MFIHPRYLKNNPNMFAHKVDAYVEVLGFGSFRTWEKYMRSQFTAWIYIYIYMNGVVL